MKRAFCRVNNNSPNKPKPNWKSAGGIGTNDTSILANVVVLKPIPATLMRNVFSSNVIFEGVRPSVVTAVSIEAPEIAGTVSNISVNMYVFSYAAPNPEKPDVSEKSISTLLLVISMLTGTTTPQSILSAPISALVNSISVQCDDFW
jgi:hypothetical protein